MEFGKFDSRKAADDGVVIDLLDPYTDEVIADGKKISRVGVRGTASRSVQADLRKRLAKTGKSKKTDPEERVMEDVHLELCEAAAPYITSFENVERDGRALTTSPEDVSWFLDLTFPDMGVKEDECGNPILDKDGDPQFKMRNKTFAKQIADASTDQRRFMGNVGKP